MGNELSDPATVRSSRSVRADPSQPGDNGLYPADGDKRKLIHFADQVYDDIVAQCKQQQKPFEDPVFPAENSSIFYSGKATVEIEWLRAVEICKRAEKPSRPYFILDGTSRFDIAQGELGDCWALAGIGTLADHPTLLNQVVPPDQSFEPNAYTGAFRFRFYQYGNWVEVIVDDRLPTYKGKPLMLHSPTTNEFWGSLLEKAYAKINGSYQGLQAGVCGDALTDFTAGVVETFNLRDKTPTGFDVDLLRAIHRGSLIGAGIYGNPSQNPVLPNGLVCGHAYTVSDVQAVQTTSSENVTLIRVRNPWGDNHEWKGAWSDDSGNWMLVSPEVREKLKQLKRDDGDFWMDILDFAKNFDQVDVCNLTADSIVDEGTHTWNTTTFDGAWIKGKTAGGRLKYKTFDWNPQFSVSLQDADDNDGSASALIELTQKDRRRVLQETGVEFLNMGFTVYKLPPGKKLPLTYDFFANEPRVGGVEYYTDLRTITKRITVPPGQYVIVVTTWEPGETGEFFLRIWSEKPHDAKAQPDDDGGIPSDDLAPTDDILPDPSNKTPRKNRMDDRYADDSDQMVPPVLREAAFRFFRSVSGTDMEIRPPELQEGLNTLYVASPKYRLSLNACKSMILLMDKSGRNTLRFRSFVTLYEFLNIWSQTFQICDQLSVGSLDEAEFQTCLETLGYSTGEDVLNLLVFRYGDDGRRVNFTAFVECLIKLQFCQVDTMLHAVLKITSAENYSFVAVDVTLLAA